MERAVRQRDVHLAVFYETVQALENALNSPDDATQLDSVTSSLDQINRRWGVLEGEFSTIQNLVPDDDLDLLEAEVRLGEKASDAYSLSRAKATAFREARTVAPPADSSAPAPVLTTPRVTIRHPELVITPFSGRIVDWTTFWSSFSAIHEDADLNADQKMRHLQRYVVGEAQRTIQGLQITAANYPIAVKLLRDRFGRTDLIVGEHLEGLQRLKPVKAATDVIDLRNLYTEVMIHTRGLETLGQAQESYGTFLAPILFRKFPPELKLAWTSKASNKITDLDGMIQLLKASVEARERCNDYTSPHEAVVESKRVPEVKRSSTPTAAGLAAHVSPPSCLFCQDTGHNLFNCPLPVADKKRVVSRKNLCFNCLRTGHAVPACSSPSCCRRCGARHHTTVHVDAAHGPAGPPHRADPPRPSSSRPPSGRPTGPTSPVYSSSVGTMPPRHPEVALATSAATSAATAPDEHISTKLILLRSATVWARTATGPLKLRALLDTACQRTIIRASTARSLGIRSSGSEMCRLLGLGGAADSLKVRRGYDVELWARGEDGQPAGNATALYALTVDAIPVPVPHAPTGDWMQELAERGILLADEVEGPEVNQEIDLLIGADQHRRVVFEDQSFDLENGLQATNSAFGWLLMGPMGDSGRSRHDRAASALFIGATAPLPDEQLHLDMKAQWALETIGILPQEQLPLPVQDHPVFQRFKESVRFDAGRYQVRLAWKEKLIPLPSNLQLAAGCATNQLNRLRRRPDVLQRYHAVFKDHLDRDFLEEVPSTEISKPLHPVHYLSHHLVERHDKTTTKDRVVFNASAHVKGHPSLNDLQEVGPNTQADLLELSLRFRTHPVAITADIEKAFLQIGLAPEDRDCTRCIWYADPFDAAPTLKHYRYKRVVFGVASSPFLLGATFLNHLDKYDPTSKAVVALKKERYVDDLATGATDDAAGLVLATDAIRICAEAGFPLRKFCTNSPSLRASLADLEGSGDPDPAIDRSKLFGLVWRWDNDDLSFDVQPVIDFHSATSHIATKRMILKTSLMLFDRMGLISPVTILPAILQQTCWTRGLDWDQELPTELRQQWDLWCHGLSALKELFVPRLALQPQPKVCDLHLFCDASEVAYGVVAYLVQSGSSPTLLTSKARVAPLKRLTIARLELLAMLLGARLAAYINRVLPELDLRPHVWSDSKVAISWMQTEPYALRTWECNRVQEGRDLVSPGSFHHVAGVENPADLCSRGATAEVLQRSTLWWNGPPWLASWTNATLPPLVDDSCLSSHERDEVRRGVKRAIPVVAAAPVVVDDTFGAWTSRFSSLDQLLRVTAYVQRFIRNATLPEGLPRSSGELTADDIADAKLWWVKRAQRDAFADDLHQLTSCKPLKEPSRLVGLRPFLDESDGLLKMTGRVEVSGEIPNSVPILPSSHPFTHLLIKDAHHRLCHAWHKLTFSQLIYRYWILNGRRTVRTVLNQCGVCKKLIAKNIVQPSGPLPVERCSSGEPFQDVGVDFAGPVFLKTPGEGTAKAYICLFTCARTRAIHLELVRDLTTPRFLMALERFTSRRGLCQTMFSDNAKTFKAADRELRTAWRNLKDCPRLQRQLATRGITWKFIPERAPWWGGFWERLVQSVKTPLKRILGRTSLKEDEFQTVLCSIEAVLNSRPLTHVYNSDRDPEPVCPASVLLGRRNTRLPPLSTSSSGIHDLSAREIRDRVAYRELLANQFWNRWRAEYLPQLRIPLKGVAEATPVAVGDVVLVKDEHAPRLLWKLGLVIHTFTSPVDGVIRAAQIKTSAGVLRRAVNHLYPLEVREDVSTSAVPAQVPIPIIQVQEEPLAPATEDLPISDPFHGFPVSEKGPASTSPFGGEDVAQRTRAGRITRPTTRYADFVLPPTRRGRARGRPSSESPARSFSPPGRPASSS